ncbi:hypothetical protein VTH82DRAFT_2506 [Thermothelomyces myriococcoides]
MASPLPTPISSSSSEPVCGFKGTSDIYGLGIRVGIYPQWLAAIAAEMASPDDMKVAQAAAANYQLAMLSGLILVTQDPRFRVFAVEAFLILLFCFAGVWVGSAPATTWGSSRALFLSPRRPVGAATTAIRDDAAIVLLLQLLLGCLACAYGTWTLFAGLRRLRRTECDEMAFFFAPVRLFGWFQDMFKVFYVISLVVSTMFLAFEFVMWLRLRETRRSEQQTSLSPSSPPAHTGRTEVPVRHTLGRVISWTIFIVAVELTLRWNGIQGVNECRTFGQLFPLVISASNLLGVCYRVAYAVLKGRILFRW